MILEPIQNLSSKFINSSVLVCTSLVQHVQKVPEIKQEQVQNRGSTEARRIKKDQPP